MSRRFALVVGSLSLVSVAACTGADRAAAPDGDDGAALTSSAPLLSGVAAVEIDIEPVSGNVRPLDVTVALPAKIDAIMRGLKKRPRYESPLRCMPGHTSRLRFFDATTKEIASVLIACGRGELQIVGPDGATSFVPVRTTVDLLEIAQAPVVAGDALWAITEIDLKERPANRSATVTDVHIIESIVRGFDPDQEIVRNHGFPPCATMQTATFKRNGRAVAASTICGYEPDVANVSASFTIHGRRDGDEPVAQGAIDVDPRAIRRALDANE